MRRDAKGETVWASALNGNLGGVRHPHLLWDAERVYVTHNDGVTTLGADTGEVLWHADRPGDCLLLSGDLLLATDCTSDQYVGEQGRLLVARAAASGAEVFKVRLPVENFDPLPIREVAGLFLVQTVERAGAKEVARLVNREGEVVHRFDRWVVAGAQEGEDRVLLTSRDVVRLSPDDKTLWAVPFEHVGGQRAGGLVEAGGGVLDP